MQRLDALFSLRRAELVCFSPRLLSLSLVADSRGLEYWQVEPVVGLVLVVNFQSVLQVIQWFLVKRSDHALVVEFLVVGWVGNLGD